MISIVVGDKGLEPSTSRSQTARASQLRQSPAILGSADYRGDYTLCAILLLVFIDQLQMLDSRRQAFVINFYI